MYACAYRSVYVCVCVCVCVQVAVLHKRLVAPIVLNTTSSADDLRLYGTLGRGGHGMELRVASLLICNMPHLLTHSLTHALMHSVGQSLTHSFTHQIGQQVSKSVTHSHPSRSPTAQCAVGGGVVLAYVNIALASSVSLALPPLLARAAKRIEYRLTAGTPIEGDKRYTRAPTLCATLHTQRDIQTDTHTNTRVRVHIHAHTHANNIYPMLKC